MEKTNVPKIIIYTPESQIHSPGLLLRSIWKDISTSHELSWRLFVRDLSALYRQSIFGILWAFAPPIVTSLIFIFLQSKNVVSFNETTIPYPVYVLIGTILWQVFTESLNAPLKSVTAAKPMLVKINFSREALIVSALYLTIFNLLIKMVVIIAVLILFRMPITWGLLLALFPIMMLILLGMCIGLFITPLGMLYTDVSTSLPIFTQLWFFLTPVVYPPSTSFPFSLLAVLNPVSPLLIAARDLITQDMITNGVAVLIVSALTIFFLFFAVIIYHISMPILIERMSA